MSDPRPDDLTIRRTTRSDVPEIVELAGRSLGWAADQRDRDFFVWKHFENPFGESPGWAAWDGDRMVAFRTMMRWEFGRATETLRMVRAVDTATDPDYQGRGLFRRLTTTAVEELADEGVDAVFNTPNDQSRPGYLKMGWEVLGRPTLHVSPRTPLTMIRLVRARIGSEKWSEDAAYGSSAPVALREPVSPRSERGWHTPRTDEYLRWRYGFEPLRYRAVEVRGGACIFRVRRRGPLREVAICEWLSSEHDPWSVRRLVKAAGDYGVGIGLSVRGQGAVPLRRQGPIMTWRSLARRSPVPMDDLSLALGDVELF